jgi:hypothetical protein
MKKVTTSGFTRLELALSSALVGAVLGAMGTTARQASLSLKAAPEVDEVGERASATTSLVAKRIAASATGFIVPTPSAPFHTAEVDYQLCTASGEAKGADLGAIERIELRLEPGEADDGVDNDGDGLVDECEIVQFQHRGSAHERVTVLCRGVCEFLEDELPNGADDNGNGLIDERGLSFDFQGDSVTVRVSLEQAGSDGRRLVRTAERRLALRGSG